jgi:hypothetical protein
MPATSKPTSTPAVARKAAGSTLPKPPARRPFYPSTLQAQAPVQPDLDGIESDEALSSDEVSMDITYLDTAPYSFQDDDDDDNDASMDYSDDEPAPTINMLVVCTLGL